MTYRVTSSVLVRVQHAKTVERDRLHQLTAALLTAQMTQQSQFLDFFWQLLSDLSDGKSCLLTKGLTSVASMCPRRYDVASLRPMNMIWLSKLDLLS